MSSLWLPGSWPERLQELFASTADRKAAPLRRDVRALGSLLGQVIREQAQPGVEHEYRHILAGSSKALRSQSLEICRAEGCNHSLVSFFTLG